jgi:hypothetical protein
MSQVAEGIHRLTNGGAGPDDAKHRAQSPAPRIAVRAPRT